MEKFLEKELVTIVESTKRIQKSVVSMMAYDNGFNDANAPKSLNVIYDSNNETNKSVDERAPHMNKKTKKVPVIGTPIAYDTSITSNENIISYIEADENIDADYCIYYNNDNMINARIFNGDMVYVRKQDEVENGEIAAVILDNETFLERVFKYQNRIELRAENPTCPPIFLDGEDMGRLKVIGKAIAFISKII